MRRARAALLAAAIAATLSCPPSVAAATISVDVTNIAETKGAIRATLFQANGWLDDSHAVARASKPAIGPRTRVEFRDIPPGRYAVALIHDADDNGDMTYTLLGLPAEGFGFSNNVKPLLSAPSFDSAAFSLGSDDKVLVVALIHL